MRLTFFVLLVCSAIIATIASAQTPFQPQTVVVSRGGVQLTFQDIDDYMQRVPADKRAGIMDSPKRIEALLLNMLLTRELAKQAVAMKLDSDPQVVGKADPERAQILARLRVEKFVEDIKMPDFEPLAHEEYLGHKDHYTARGTRTVQRIFVSSKAIRASSKEIDAKAAEQEAWNRASQVRTEALAAPDQFEALVAKYSDDPDKAQTHGVLVDTNPPKGDRWLAEALQTLHKPGDISEVYTSPGGYQVVKLVSAEPDVVQPFSAVREKIVAALKDNYVEAQRRDFIDQISSEKIDANADAVASLRIRYNSPATAAPANHPGADAQAHGAN
ncbi:MAG TPA: peptidylprolyl isomerase [Rudaea sp.]|nr:peptidylprolyl isomerase [Rudaea sp.]